MAVNTTGYWDTANNREAETGIEGDPVPTSATGSQEDGENDAKFLQYAQDAVTTAEGYMSSNLRHRYSNSYKAFGNEHYTRSKYLSSQYKGRSRLFRPKTRSAVRKGDATAASALFATSDVVNVMPENEDDENQRASAMINHELLNYRLDRTSKGGISWFLTAIGASQDARITGICISKQYWDYDERIETRTVEEIDPETGEIGRAHV